MLSTIGLVLLSDPDEDGVVAAPGTISAAVLAGGESRRMGTDKALLDWDGRPLIEHELTQLRASNAAIDDIRVIGERPEYHQLGLPVHRDRFQGAGTLGGIATALHYATHDYVLVVACDMPLLSSALLSAMIDEPRDFDVLVPALRPERSDQGGSQTFETLHAIYRTSCLPAIEREIAADRLKVIGFFDQVRVRTLSEDWMRSFDPGLHSVMNVNNPDQLAFARQVSGVDSQEDR